MLPLYNRLCRKNDMCNFGIYTEHVGGFLITQVLRKVIDIVNRGLDLPCPDLCGALRDDRVDEFPRRDC